MLNTGLRTGELLGLLNSDIDLERRIVYLERGVKEVWRRDGLQAEPGRDVKVGKLKSATSKRTVPLNDTAVAMIQDLRKEAYFGENTALVPDEHGNFTRPVNFRKRYYRILAAAGIEKKGLHSLRHTFASNLVNGIKQEDGSIKSLAPRQVADLLGHSTSQITELYYVKKDAMRQDAQKQSRKFCRSKEGKNSETHPEKPEKGETGCVPGAGEGSSGWRRMKLGEKGCYRAGKGGTTPP